MFVEFTENLSNKCKIDFQVDLIHAEVLNKVIEFHFVAPGNMFGTRVPFFPFRKDHSLICIFHRFPRKQRAKMATLLKFFGKTGLLLSRSFVGRTYDYQHYGFSILSFSISNVRHEGIGTEEGKSEVKNQIYLVQLIILRYYLPLLVLNRTSCHDFTFLFCILVRFTRLPTNQMRCSHETHSDWLLLDLYS